MARYYDEHVAEWNRRSIKDYVRKRYNQAGYVEDLTYGWIDWMNHHKTNWKDFRDHYCWF